MKEPVAAYDIAIVGGGFSGCMVLANLVRLSTRPLKIALIDASGRSPLGTAYSTPRMEHLLNVPAERMGAFADEPKGFLQWLQASGQSFGPDDFVPRLLYGQYLRHILDETLRSAEKKNIAVTQMNAEVVDALPGSPVTLLTNSAQLTAAAVVLCTGNHFASFAPAGKRYICDVWRYDKNALAQAAASGLPVVLIGTGLTAVDVLCSLQRDGWQGKIIALSRHGKFPMPHAQAPVPAWPKETWDALGAPLHLVALLHAIRAQAALAKTQGVPWQSVIDSLRPHTQRLWQALSTADQQRVFSRYITLWNIYRHRMPKPAERMISALQDQGRLTVHTGSVAQVAEHDAHVTVRYANGQHDTSLAGALVFDCTGPRMGQLPPLARLLAERGLATRCANGVGLRVDAQMKASDSVYVVGTLTVGTLLESTSVPNLCEQAHLVASALASAA